MILEEKIKAYKALGQEIEALEEQRKALGKETLADMPSKTLLMPGYKATRYTRLVINVPLEQARLLGATKTEEQVDKVKIKKLLEMGQSIECIQEVAYLDKRQ